VGVEYINKVVNVTTNSTKPTNPREIAKVTSAIPAHQLRADRAIAFWLVNSNQVHQFTVVLALYFERIRQNLPENEGNNI
jgi:hypothetical protein